MKCPLVPCKQQVLLVAIAHDLVTDLMTPLATRISGEVDLVAIALVVFGSECEPEMYYGMWRCTGAQGVWDLTSWRNWM